VSLRARVWVVVSLAGCSLITPLDGLAPGDSGADATTDAGNDSGAVIDASVLKSLPGLVVWLDARNVTLDVSMVSVWPDQSGQKNDATQPAGPARPTMIDGAINGQPALHFTIGTQLVINDSASMEWGTDDFYLAYVARFTNSPDGGATSGYGTLFLKGTPDAGLGVYANMFSPSLTITPGVQMSLGPGGSEVIQSPGPYNDGVARLYTFARQGTSLQIRVDGNVTATQAVSPFDVSGQPFTVVIGSLAAQQNLEGDISEIVAVRGALAANDRTAIEAYLNGKYALW